MTMRRRTPTTLRKMVTLHVEQHDSHMPHSAFRGVTLDQLCSETAATVPQQLSKARMASPRARLAANRKFVCPPWEPDRLLS